MDPAAGRTYFISRWVTGSQPDGGLVAASVMQRAASQPAGPSGGGAAEEGRGLREAGRAVEGERPGVAVVIGRRAVFGEPGQLEQPHALAAAVDGHRIDLAGADGLAGRSPVAADSRIVVP